MYVTGEKHEFGDLDKANEKQNSETTQSRRICQGVGRKICIGKLHHFTNTTFPITD